MTIVQVPKPAEIDDSKTFAFAKLEGAGIKFYMTKIEVGTSLGRQFSTGPQHADVPLSNNSAIDKYHDQLIYNFYNTRFELVVTGQSGATVGGNYVRIGTSESLQHKNSNRQRVFQVHPPPNVLSTSKAFFF